MTAFRLARELGYANPYLMLAEMGGTSVFRDHLAVGLIDEQDRMEDEMEADVRSRMNG